MVQTPLVISFYTVDTPYQQEVLHLIASCKLYGIEHQIEGVSSRGSWLRNVAMKPEFICAKLLEHKRPVFWVDADAVFKSKPDLNQFCPYDIAVREVEAYRDDPWLKLAAGSVFFNYSAKMKMFAKQWVELCRSRVEQDVVNLFFLDQISLLQMIESFSGLQVGALPLGYCKIFDEPSPPSEEIVIEHYQASRRFASGI